MFNLSPEDAMEEAREDIKECMKEISKPSYNCRCKFDAVGNLLQKCEVCSKDL